MFIVAAASFSLQKAFFLAAGISERMSILSLILSVVGASFAGASSSSPASDDRVIACELAWSLSLLLPVLPLSSSDQSALIWPSLSSVTTEI